MIVFSASTKSLKAGGYIFYNCKETALLKAVVAFNNRKAKVSQTEKMLPYSAAIQVEIDNRYISFFTVTFAESQPEKIELAENNTFTNATWARVKDGSLGIYTSGLIRLKDVTHGDKLKAYAEKNNLTTHFCDPKS